MTSVIDKNSILIEICNHFKRIIMKLNWGQSIVVALILFIGFIMYFVITMMTDQKYDNDLVVESYYEKDLTLQNDIDQKKNAMALEERVTIDKSEQGLMVTFLIILIIKKYLANFLCIVQLIKSKISLLI